MATLAELAESIERTGVLFCTVATRSHLNYAWCLRHRLRHYHPQAPFCVLVVDCFATDELPEERYFDCPLIRLDAFATPAILEMTVYYTAYELCGNIKPAFLLHLFETTKARKIIYLDGDLFVTGPLWAALGRLDTHDVTCAPHLLAPLPDDEKEPSDLTVAASGSFNSGFMGFARSKPALDLLAWMARRVRRQGFLEFSQNMFCEQLFLNLGVVFLRERFGPLFLESYNVGYWNLHERTIEYRDEAYFANGQRIAYFHLSGFNPAAPNKLSRHEERYTLADHPQAEILRRVIADYQQHLREAPFTAHRGYRFETLGGKVLTTDLRRLYFETVGAEGEATLDRSLDAARSSAQAGEYEKASEIYAMILERSPDSIDALYGHGLVLMQLARYVEAREAFRQVLARDPRHDGAGDQLCLLPLPPDGA